MSLDIKIPVDFPAVFAFLYFFLLIVQEVLQECHDLFVRLPGCSTQHYIFDDSIMNSHEDGILRQVN